uniref:Uncharacterized protein n=1 Tax=Anguilla anguilla TaxID=7936 RepID=A0A0E9VD86_ANGAN
MGTERMCVLLGFFVRKYRILLLTFSTWFAYRTSLKYRKSPLDTPLESSKILLWS